MGVQGDPRPCSIANALAVIGEKWTLLTLREVFLGVHRFDQIAMNTGVSRDILALRLGKLVEAGVLVKKQYQDRPVRNEYHLTRVGADLQDVLMTLMAWGDRHATEGPAPMVMTHSCGERFTPQLVCANCHEPAGPGTLTPAASRTTASTAGRRVG